MNLSTKTHVVAINTDWFNEGCRYRDPKTGTFLTKDPAGFVDGPNLYAYVHQNPWSKFDPQGLAALSENAPSDDEIRQCIVAIKEQHSEVSGKLKEGSYYSQHEELTQTASSLVKEQKFLTKVLEVRERIGPNGYGEWQTGKEFDRAFGWILGIGSETAKARPYFTPAGGYLGTAQDVAKVEAAGAVMQASVAASVAVPLVVEGAAILPGTAKAAWVATEPVREAATALSYGAVEKVAEVSATASVLANQKLIETTHQIMNKALAPANIMKAKQVGEVFTSFFDKNPPTSISNKSTAVASALGMRLSDVVEDGWKNIKNKFNDR